MSSSSSSQSCRQINPFNQISSPIEAVESSYNIELEDIALSMDEVITAKIDTEEIREERYEILFMKIQKLNPIREV